MSLKELLEVVRKTRLGTVADARMLTLLWRLSTRRTHTQRAKSGCVYNLYAHEH